MTEIKKLITDYQTKYLNYYSQMMQSIDYVTYLENQFNIKDIGVPENIRQMYPEVYEIVSLSELRKINVTSFRVQIIEPFLKSLDDSAQEKLGNIWVGHVPIRRPNALCRYVPHTIIPIVIIYDKILGVLSYRAETYLIFGELLKHDKDKAFLFLNYSSKKIVDFFTGKNVSLPLYDLPLPIKEHSLLIASAQELFLIAHEFAHIFLDHLDFAETNNLYFEQGDIKIELFSFEQKLEFEADLQAAKWIIEFRNKGLAKNLLSYANYFSTVTEIFVLLYLIQVNSGDVSGDKKMSHPPAEVRLQHILENLKENLNKSEIRDLENILKNFSSGFTLPEIKITEELDDAFSLLVNKFLFKT